MKTITDVLYDNSLLLRLQCSNVFVCIVASLTRLASPYFHARDPRAAAYLCGIEKSAAAIQIETVAGSTVPPGFSQDEILDLSDCEVLAEVGILV